MLRNLTQPHYRHSRYEKRKPVPRTPGQSWVEGGAVLEGRAG